jgi:hypothetical protein
MLNLKTPAPPPTSKPERAGRLATLILLDSLTFYLGATRVFHRQWRQMGIPHKETYG